MTRDSQRTQGCIWEALGVHSYLHALFTYKFVILLCVVLHQRYQSKQFPDFIQNFASIHNIKQFGGAILLKGKNSCKFSYLLQFWDNLM